MTAPPTIETIETVLMEAFGFCFLDPNKVSCVSIRTCRGISATNALTFFR
jgi:hypothetical protein